MMIQFIEGKNLSNHCESYYLKRFWVALCTLEQDELILIYDCLTFIESH